MFNIASEETYQDGQVILKEGSSGDWVYVILSGSVEISKMVGARKYVIEVLKPDEVFGELGFLGGINRTATARALGETTLGIIDRTSLDQEFNKLSGDFRTILVSIVERFKKMIEKTSAFSSRQETRIAKVLSLTFKERQSFIKAYTGNISPGGLFITTKKPLKEGEQFLLKLQLPDITGPLKIKCEVVWTKKQEQSTKDNPAGMGVRFSEMDKKDNQILKQYLNDINT